MKSGLILSPRLVVFNAGRVKNLKSEIYLSTLMICRISIDIENTGTMGMNMNKHLNDYHLKIWILSFFIYLLSL